MSVDPSYRLKTHNRIRVKSSKSNVPWRIVHLKEFDNRLAAREYEKYLKSAAGRRFRKKQLGL